MTDPIADFLARIRNGIRARKADIVCPRSNMKLRLAEILRDEGFLGSVTASEDNKQGTLKLTLGQPTREDPPSGNNRADIQISGAGFSRNNVPITLISMPPSG